MTNLSILTVKTGVKKEGNEMIKRIKENVIIKKSKYNDINLKLYLGELITFFLDLHI